MAGRQEGRKGRARAQPPSICLHYSCTHDLRTHSTGNGACRTHACGWESYMDTGRMEHNKEAIASGLWECCTCCCISSVAKGRTGPF